SDPGQSGDGVGARRLGDGNNCRTSTGQVGQIVVPPKKGKQSSQAHRIKLLGGTVEAVLCRDDTLVEDVLDGVSRFLDRDFELGPLALSGRGEHVTDAMLLARRFSDADANPGEGIAVQVGFDGPEAVVAGQAAAGLDLDPA